MDEEEKVTLYVGLHTYEYWMYEDEPEKMDEECIEVPVDTVGEEINYIEVDGHDEIKIDVDYLYEHNHDFEDDENLSEEEKTRLERLMYDASEYDFDTLHSVEKRILKCTVCIDLDISFKDFDWKKIQIPDNINIYIKLNGKDTVWDEDRCSPKNIIYDGKLYEGDYDVQWDKGTEIIYGEGAEE